MATWLVFAVGSAGCDGGSPDDDDAGTPDASVCGPGQLTCGGTCVDTRTNIAHCGACNTACDPGEVCSAGSCAATCPTGQSVCGGGCFDLRTSRDHCGVCTTACDPGAVCVASACATSCPTGQIVCGGTCVDPDTDRTYCGASAACTGDTDGTVCGAGTVCFNGACAASCGAPLMECSATCVDTRTDPRHCGACGDACPTPANGTAFCTPPGTCASACTVGFVDCNEMPDDGCEASVRNDAANCGGCRRACDRGGYCAAGECETFPADSDLSTLRTQGTCADGGDMVSYSVMALSSTSATLTAAPSEGCLAVGDSVLLINLQGAAGATANVGNYELLTVASVSGATVSFLAAKARYYGSGAADDEGLGTTAGTQRVVLQRVPRYRDLTIVSGVTFRAAAWDGARGGVFALRATGALTVEGTIAMNEAGFEGAPQTVVEFADGAQGASTAGLGATAISPNIGGGGGGLGEACASHGVSGGGGGHQDPGGASTHGCGGQGGLAYANAGRLFLGSGGGAGGVDNVLSDNPPGGFGGRGGGIVLLWAASATVTGSIEARGGAGQGDAFPGCGGGSTTDCWDYSGPGGGGGGGSIAVVTDTFTGAPPVVAGGPGGLGGPAGNGGDGGLGVGITQPRSCSEALAWQAGATDGTYAIDPDGVGPVAPFDAYCDMANGGWTLIMATNGVGPDLQTEVLPVVPFAPGTIGPGNHLPAAAARALAFASTQVHIRTAGLIATESITSVPNALAIQNLRSGIILNANSTLTSSEQDPSAFWTGPRATDSTYLWHTCGPSPHEGMDLPYPTIYWACNNGGGIHITHSASAWTSTAGTLMEVYVR